MPYETYKELVEKYGATTVNTSPLCRFKTQRNSAKQRGIAWEMTFAEWWAIWQESGKWDQRGRGYGYAMARIGDSGPYKIDNIEIITSAQNTADSYIVKPAAKRVEMGLATKRKNGTLSRNGGREKKRFVVMGNNKTNRFMLYDNSGKKPKYHSFYKSREAAQSAGERIFPGEAQNGR